MKRLRWAALLLMLLGLCGCGQSQAQGVSGLRQTGSMELAYAEQFQVDYYEGGYGLITIGGTDSYLLVPEGQTVPEGMDAGVTVLRQPLEHIYLASSSAMDLFLQGGGLDAVTMTSTDGASWAIPAIQARVQSDDILYVGKYSAPDYEVVLDEGCDLALENTMIYHCPETKEKLEQLGIPVLVERSSYESHPLGRVEWIKLYGLLTGTLEQAEAFFNASAAQLQSLEAQEPTGKTVAFFYITASGYANVRRPGDYISRMIALAGGRYIFEDLADDGDSSLSTMNMQMEQFYAGARDADILIYNSTVEGELASLEDLLDKSPVLKEFRAVQNGNVWCTGQNMFQQVSGTAEMIADLHTIISGEAEDTGRLTFLYRLQ